MLNVFSNHRPEIGVSDRRVAARHEPLQSGDPRRYGDLVESERFRDPRDAIFVFGIDVGVQETDRQRFEAAFAELRKLLADFVLVDRAQHRSVGGEALVDLDRALGQLVALNDVQPGVQVAQNKFFLAEALPLAGNETAIVTPIAGTTRDVLREHIQIDGMPLHIIDTAGLRDSGDLIEQEGVRRAWAQVEQADRVLLIIDDQIGFSAEDQQVLDRLPRRLPHTLVYNKIDLGERTAGIDRTKSATEVSLSATTGEGLDYLRSHLKAAMGYEESGAGSFSARQKGCSDQHGNDKLQYAGA